MAADHDRTLGNRNPRKMSTENVYKQAERRSSCRALCVAKIEGTASINFLTWSAVPNCKRLTGRQPSAIISKKYRYNTK
jgi:hypothetical protein